MSQVRFEYLLERFKTDKLWETEIDEWHAMVELETYKPLLDGDIVLALADTPVDARWNAAIEQDAWQSILNETGRAWSGI